MAARRAARPRAPAPRTRPLTVFAQDPGVRVGGQILTTQLEVPVENLSPGPMGVRLHVIDYDASTGTLYKAHQTPMDPDPYAGVDTERLLADPKFHQQNAYAISMTMLGRFERALGRRVTWSFPYGGHQLKIAPHAFADANAFYSRDDEALLFGYFRGRRNHTIFSCLAHDVIAHETSHALLDGLRYRFMYPSSPDQAAFHEGFSDVVALLAVFSQPDVVAWAIDRDTRKQRRRGPGAPSGLIRRGRLTAAELKRSTLLSLAGEMGSEMSGVRGSALRRSAELDPEDVDLRSDEFLEPHRRGEVLVAAMLNAFLEIWVKRLQGLHRHGGKGLDRQRVIEEGADVADRLMTAAIRAIDFTPPVDLLFSDYLSALLTADLEISPNDSRYHLRETLTDVFGRFGIQPASLKSPLGRGMWDPAPARLDYSGMHFESMQRDPDEVFRFVWENRRRLGLYDTYTQVQSVRPSVRVDFDGFVLHETVVEYFQVLRLRAGELKRVKLQAPKGVSSEREIALYGGGALVFDEYGRLRFHIYNSVDSQRQQARLDYLQAHGALDGSGRDNLGAFHRSRSIRLQSAPTEEW